MNKKIIALVDCNSFYCSCERLFRPDLKNVPVGVLSNNDGCFVSRTKELKKLGVKMGEPYFKVKDICEKNNVAVFSANFALYTDLSRRVMNVLKDFAPIVEIYSVDEAFLDLTEVKMNDLEKYIRNIKIKIEKRTGIPVSIGVGSTKTLAKIANNLAKKDESLQGVLVILDENSVTNALKKTPVEKIWGIGKAKSSKLKALGIRSALEFYNFKNENLIQKLFTKVGRKTQDELRGIYCFEISEDVEKKKEIITSRTFGSPVYYLQSLKESIANFASLACEKLRKQNSVCSQIDVWVRTNPFKETSQYYAIESYKFQTHTADTRKIIKAAWECLQLIYKPGFEYKKALIRLYGIRDKEEAQLSLFECPDSTDSETLMKCIDSINLREGPNSVKSAGCGVSNKSWIIKQSQRSPRYLTGWRELRTVS